MNTSSDDEYEYADWEIDTDETVDTDAWIVSWVDGKPTAVSYTRIGTDPEQTVELIRSLRRLLAKEKYA